MGRGGEELDACMALDQYIVRWMGVLIHQLASCIATEMLSLNDFNY